MHKFEIFFEVIDYINVNYLTEFKFIQYAKLNIEISMKYLMY